jgi:hypothetical protein
MPPLVRAIDPKYLVPLRSTWNAPAKSLLDHHQANHPNEPKLRPTIRSYGIFGNAIFYEFYGRQITPSTAQFHKREFDYHNGMTVPESEAAAMLLERTFKSVSWDTANERIVGITENGEKYSIEGTNVVQAGLALTIMRAEAEKHSSGAERGIGWVEAVFHPQTFLSKAASPLQVIITVPDDPNLYSDAIRRGFQLALANRL